MQVLLVHGGCHGAWCWQDVQRYLSGAGIASMAVDLPGSGADHTPRRSVALADYVDAIDSAIDACAERGDGVLVVGHSIAGLSIPAAVSRHRDDVVGVLLIAALIVARGDKGIDSIPADRRPGYFEMAERSGDGTLLPAFEAAWQRFFPSMSRERAEYYYSQLTPQPLQVYLDPNTQDWTDLGVHVQYVLLERDRTFPPDFAREFAQRAGAGVVVRPGDHCWMLTDPVACADAIAEFALDLQRR